MRFGAVSVDVDAVPEDPVRAEQSRLEGRFIDFLYSSIQSFVCATENWDIVIEVNIFELQRLRKVHRLVSTRIFSSSVLVPNRYTIFFVSDLYQKVADPEFPIFR